MSFLRRPRKHIEQTVANENATVQELEYAEKTVSALWSSIRKAGGGNNIYNDLDVSFAASSGKATIRKQFSPSMGATMSIFQDIDGIWNVRTSKYRPGSEFEPQGSVLMTSTSYALSPAGGVIEDGGAYRQMNNGEFVLDSQLYIMVHEHVTTAMAHALISNTVAIEEASRVAFDPNVV